MAIGMEGNLSTAYGLNAVNMMFGGMSNTQNFAYNSELMKEQNKFNAQQAQLQRDFNAQQAQLQRDYEKEMSSTAYQRALADMQKAGFNPALLMNGSSVASTPSGATAQGVAAHGNAPSFSGSLSAGAVGQMMSAAAKDKELALEMAKAEKQAMVEEARANYYNSAATYKNLLADDLKDMQRQDLKNREEQFIKDYLPFKKKRF